MPGRATWDSHARSLDALGPGASRPSSPRSARSGRPPRSPRACARPRPSATRVAGRARSATGTARCWRSWQGDDVRDDHRRRDRHETARPPECSLAGSPVKRMTPDARPTRAKSALDRQNERPVVQAGAPVASVSKRSSAHPDEMARRSRCRPHGTRGVAPEDLRGRGRARRISSLVFTARWIPRTASSAALGMRHRGELAGTVHAAERPRRGGPSDPLPSALGDERRAMAAESTPSESLALKRVPGRSRLMSDRERARSIDQRCSRRDAAGRAQSSAASTRWREGGQTAQALSPFLDARRPRTGTPSSKHSIPDRCETCLAAICPYRA